MAKERYEPPRVESLTMEQTLAEGLRHAQKAKTLMAEISNLSDSLSGKAAVLVMKVAELHVQLEEGQRQMARFAAIRELMEAAAQDDPPLGPDDRYKT